jgi:Domain of unknown function (DUF4263)
MDGAQPVDGTTADARPWSPWEVSGLLDAAEAAAPAFLDHNRYLQLLEPSWSSLLDSQESRREAVVQDFLERHPCLLPGAFSVDGQSGHAPWPAAVITQPMLPELSTRQPDFMWIATDSETTYPVLIEIETPHSRWWYTTGTEVHGDLSHARGQLAEWRGWFAKPQNQIAFADYYELPSMLRRRKLEPRYVLIHGRRSETGEDPQRLAKRRELSHPQERLMSFDRLQPDPKAAGLFCVRRGPSGYLLHRAPPSFVVHDGDDHRYVAINGWAEGLAASPEVPTARAAFVLDEVEKLRAEHATRQSGVRRSNPR